MPVLTAYNTAPSALQPPAYTNAVLLAANTPEFVTVPTDNNTGLKAKYVKLKGTGDFYAQAFDTNNGTDPVANGTFAEYITNGAFASDTGWTKGTGWAIAAGVASATTASTALSQTSAITLVAGRTYTITYTTTRSAGTVTPSIGGTAGTTRSTAATFTETIVAGSTQILAFTGVGFTGTIDNVSVTAWVLGTGWTTDGTTAIATGAISTALSQTAIAPYLLVEGQGYWVTFVATRSAGTVTVNVGGTAGSARSSSATFSEYIIAGATQAIEFTTSGFTGTIDTVSVIPAAKVAIDNTSGYASPLNPEGFALNERATVIGLAAPATPTVTLSFYK